MTAEDNRPACPHCGQPLRPFQLPENSGWDEQIHLACFNDECPYFRRGWTWMFEKYGVKASYRFRIDPASGNESPLAVWSKDAVKDRILDADVIAEPHDSADVNAGKTGDRGQGPGVRPSPRTKTKTATAPPPRKGKKA
jgi:hypothetical protein